MLADRSRWWQLYGLGALMLAALIWVHGLGLADQAEMTLQIVVVIVVFGLIFVWRRNSGAASLNQADEAEFYAYPDDAALDLPEPERALGGGSELAAGPGDAPLAPSQPAVRAEIAGSVLD